MQHPRSYIISLVHRIDYNLSFWKYIPISIFNISKVEIFNESLKMDATNIYSLWSQISDFQGYSYFLMSQQLPSLLLKKKISNYSLFFHI